MPRLRYNVVGVSFRFPCEDVDAWRTHATSQRQTFTQWVREACEARLTTEAMAMTRDAAPVDRDQMPLPFMDATRKARKAPRKAGAK